MTAALLTASALLAGVLIGVHRTRRAVRTTDGRRRHGIDRARTIPHHVITGEVGPAQTPPPLMEEALRAATQHTRALHAGPAPTHPPTVAIPRIDGTLPQRPPAPHVTGAITRGTRTPGPRRKPTEWSTRA